MKQQFIVGIDLGTSNTVVAFAKPGQQQVELLAIEQLVGPGQVAARPLLPSVRFHAAPGEFRPADLQLPWRTDCPAADEQALSGHGQAVIAGYLALDLGAQVPGRLVSSAKSWLSHAGVDRLAPILPWGAADEVFKVSPVAASASYLAHVRAAWRQRFPGSPLEEQQLILTVPASFDEGARALTLEAARVAGLPRLRLLEEPQAAFYDWLFRHRSKLAEALAQTRLLLVCDVGGGTSDFCLIRVAMDGDGAPVLTRIGVGQHLMLGGDNMDLTLAHHLESRLSKAGIRLSAARFSQLSARCRTAKEQLLATDAPESVPVTLLGAGARLVGDAKSVDLSRDEVLQLIVDGFFPQVGAEETLHRRRAALVEFGLPYPADPAITRHLSDFLRRHAHAAGPALASQRDGERCFATDSLPDTLLLNGGVFRSSAIVERLHNTLSDWRGGPLNVLHNDQPDLAVARGAVAYALMAQGQGSRIGGGSARSYFLVLDGVSGQKGEGTRGLCLLPRGSEEGDEIRLGEHDFSLRLGQPVRFHLASSLTDRDYQPGEVAVLNEADFIRLPPLSTVVRDGVGSARRDVRVQLISAITEVGTLELHCVSTDDATRRWLLQFELRGMDGEAPVAAPTAVLPPRFGDALACLELIFGDLAQPVERAMEMRREVRRLRGQLEHLLGPREDWPLPLLRALFDVLMQCARRRRRSAEHERVWLNLAGYCLRPGVGDPLDEWRIEQLCPLLAQGINYAGESQNWSEWWTLWRRAAGGLPAGIQENLLADLAPALRSPPVKSRSRLTVALKGSHDDMIRLAASLERVSLERKVELGEALLGRLRQETEKALCWWALGRLGARQSLYGSAHQVVPPEVASRWVDALLAVDWKKVESAAFAATQIARLTGDRARDLPDSQRQRVLERLMAHPVGSDWARLLSTVIELGRDDERRAFGETLPAGLRLIMPVPQSE